MSVVEEMLKNIPLPKMVRVRQQFLASEIQNVVAELRQQIRQPKHSSRVKKGMKIAIAVGSRGMAEIPLIAKTVVEELKRLEAIPFVVPAMGSHGGATDQGQKDTLANLGVTEASIGCPIVSSMEVVELGNLADGLPVLMDKNAYEADGIVVINRIKAHNCFSGPVESGLSKMLTIGLGKQKGADACHSFGFKKMSEHVIAMAEIKMQKANFLFGVGTVENAYDRIAKIVVVAPEKFIETDKKLLVEAKANLPKILFKDIDVLIVDQLGKEFSGGGMDPHIVGRASTDAIIPATPSPTKMAVLDVSDYSQGNCCGMGLADATTRRLFNKINFDYTYPNVMTSRATNSGRIPLIMESDRLAIQCVIKTCGVPDMEHVRMVRIPNSGHINEIYISEVLLPEAQACKDVSIITQPEEFVFDAAGNLNDIGFKKA